MAADRIDVIATTVSGSISDWKKVEQIVPLFKKHGFGNVQLHVTGSHAEARRLAREVTEAGGRIPISAGGSGTFRAVLEGCCDSGAPLDDIRLGFLRKGSADLIGKVLGMPDEIEEAIGVFATSIRADRTMPCDVLEASSGQGGEALRFVGYGGAEIFGRIPHFTESRWMKWYKGILGQLFGDLGPFSTGMTLALLEKVVRSPWIRARSWRIRVDGKEVAEGRYQALIIVNGYLGPDLPFSAEPLGSGAFDLFALADQGMRRLPAQAMRTRDLSIMENPDAWGMAHYRATSSLQLSPDTERPFPANVDGSTLQCRRSLHVRIVDRVRLISKQ